MSVAPYTRHTGGGTAPEPGKRSNSRAPTRARKRHDQPHSRAKISFTGNTQTGGNQDCAFTHTDQPPMARTNRRFGSDRSRLRQSSAVIRDFDLEAFGRLYDIQAH